MQLVSVGNRIFLCFSLFLLFFASPIIGSKRYGKILPMRSRMVLRRMGMGRETLKPKICYELLGCFADPPPHLTIKRPPENPSVIQTRFLLYTREERKSPEYLQYGDDLQSIIQSRFNSSKPLRVIIHGYKGSGSDTGAVLLAKGLLDLEDVNVLLLDWTRGAATTYAAAVANTELVGRQLGLVLLDTISIGVDPKKIHVIGFSLGAHIAGCASEILKRKNVLLGRITGLDPASPFFRHHLFREKFRKLDATDAQLVDVIHTDGSEDFSDGFGLLKPLGHIDFFPNGGREQPGCSDVKHSVVVSHLKEDALTKDIACSHLRAWLLFLESIQTQNQSCKFNAWPCSQGGLSFAKGTCFPMESDGWFQEMGYGVNRGPLGIYYLPTRGEPPFCGQPLRAAVTTADRAPKTLGMLYLKLIQENSTTMFKIRCSLLKRRNDGVTFYNIASAKYQSLPENLASIKAHVSYRIIDNETEQVTTKYPDSDILLLNKLSVEDQKGNRWEYYHPQTAVTSQEIQIELHK